LIGRKDVIGRQGELDRPAQVRIVGKGGVIPGARDGGDIIPQRAPDITAFVDHDDDYRGEAGTIADGERARATDEAGIKYSDSVVIDAERVGRDVKVVIDSDDTGVVGGVNHVPVFQRSAG
jgi:hypothetical protein